MVIGVNWGRTGCGTLIRTRWYPRVSGPFAFRFDFQDTAHFSPPLTGGLAIKKAEMVGL